MALNQRLRNLLSAKKLPYEILIHRHAYTAQEVAQASHVAGRLLAKPVVVCESEDCFYMAVVSAPQHVDLTGIHRMTGRPKGRLASEDELRRLFPDCDLGAMPPIGKLYGMPLYMDEEFRAHDDIYFQAGNHEEIVKMRFEDFEKLAGPFTGEFTVHRESSKIAG
jgi:Ala-tRNA(Pro) deacylase